ncbi:MAG TPA: aminotransferase class I/II-fold pyridoxal phosphate-dependent enzyme [Gemmatimonadaceae bacterium]|nr:aminotransferase class I/II-fold pyridoxal phosphate-dependent enzyme [Gemmatimonadaceae bacterium]
MTHFYDLLSDRVTLGPDRPALTIVSGSGDFGPAFTFRELDAAARALSRALREAAQPGHRALLLLPTSIDYVVAFFGCLHAGIVAIPAYAPHHRRADERIDGIVRDASPAIIISTSALIAKLRGSAAAAAWPAEVTWIATDEVAAAPTDEAPRHADARGLAYLQYTSGSTREPRGVRITHDNIRHNTGEIAVRVEGDAGDSIASWVPLFHDMGLLGVLTSVRGGGHMHLMSPADFTARPALWLETVSRSAAMMTFGPNFAYDLCAKRVADDVVGTLDLSSLRVALTGAEPVRLETIDAFSERFAPAGFRRDAFFPAYGMAECTLMVSGGGATRPHHVTIDNRSNVACGATVDGLDVRIVDGEVWVSGPSVADGYWNRDAESDETFGAQLPGESHRYLRTGDLGAMVDGQLVITGRAKDLVILRGANVHPQDVEPAVAECHPALSGGVAAVGATIADEERLVIVAEVTRHAATHGVDGDEVLAAVRAAVANAVNAEVGALALVRPLTIPRTSSGKIRRGACRDAWLAGELATVWSWSIDTSPETAPDAAPSAPADVDDDIMNVLREEIARELRAAPESLDVDRPLAELGLDSLGIVAIRGAVEGRLARSISIESIADNPTMRELAGRLRGAPHADDAGLSPSSQTPGKTRDVFARPMADTVFDQMRDTGLMCFYQEFGDRRGPHIRYGDRWVLQLGSLDYLGLSIDPRVREAAARAAQTEGTSRTGSRLHNGATAEQRAFERRLAEFVGKEDALVFATGYQAQLGLISGLADPDTTVVLDEYAHASLYDGALISRCRIVRFKHNDVEDLDRTLSRLPLDAPALVIAEGMYSNEGDLAPLREIVAACAAHGVRLALDEAHALGVLGATGRGSEEHFDIPGGVDILAGTFSKSLASIGGWIAGPAKVIDWIRFHGRSILFSAAIAPPALAAAAASLDVLAAEPWRVAKVRELAQRWRDALAERGLEIGDPRGPVVPVYLGDDLRCLRVSRELLDRGIYVNTAIHPSVPQGKALLRTCVTAAHEWEQLESAADVIADAVKSDALRARPQLQAELHDSV